MSIPDQNTPIGNKYALAYAKGYSDGVGDTLCTVLILALVSGAFYGLVLFFS